MRSGSYNTNANDATDYGKMAVAIATIQGEGVIISNPDINNPQFEFVPDTKNNKIIFSMKGINGINTELAQSIIANHPYRSMSDFATRMLDTKIIQPSQMIKLIKGGCFTQIHDSDRFETMKWYLNTYHYTPVNKLTLSQLNKAIEYNIIPESIIFSLKCLEYKKYVLDDEGFIGGYIDPTKSKIPKRGYHDGRYILDAESQEFFKKYFTEDSVVDVQDGFYILSEKKFTKEVDAMIQPLKDWLSSQEAVDAYNAIMYQALWDKYASGTEASWSMESLSYYDQEHELAHVPEEYYGISNFFELPENPEPYTWFNITVDGEQKVIPKYRITRIAGTVLNADNNHNTVTILTTHGVVNVKLYKGSYAFYNKRISQIQEDGSKKVLEESWFKRGNKIMVNGIRRDDQFFPKIYRDTIYKHTIILIKDIKETGEMVMQFERNKDE